MHIWHIAACWKRPARRFVGASQAVPGRQVHWPWQREGAKILQTHGAIVLYVSVHIIKASFLQVIWQGYDFILGLPKLLAL